MSERRLWCVEYETEMGKGVWLPNPGRVHMDKPDAEEEAEDAVAKWYPTTNYRVTEYIPAEEARELLREARLDARVLAHAYEHDSRPPPDVVERSLRWTVRGDDPALEGRDR